MPLRLQHELGFHSTKEVSKAPSVLPSGACMTSFHSTKEVSKGQKEHRTRRFRQHVSIPLRKFPRAIYRTRDRAVIISFHSTKEVSKGERAQPPEVGQHGFHSTKEVSKGRGRRDFGECHRVSIPLRKFPRWRAEGPFPVICLVSIPLRKFPRWKTDTGWEIKHLGFHSTKEVSKGAPGVRRAHHPQGFPFH